MSKKTENPYNAVYRDAFDNISQDEKNNNVIEKRYNAAFIDEVGCLPKVMASIDKLYDDIHAEYLGKIARLDAKFGDLKKKRSEYIASILEKKVNAVKASLKLKDTLSDFVKIKKIDCIESCFSDFSKRAEENIKDLDLAEDEIKHIIDIWFGDKEAKTKGVLKVNEANVSQLSASLKQDIEKIIVSAQHVDVSPVVALGWEKAVVADKDPIVMGFGDSNTRDLQMFPAFEEASSASPAFI